MSEQKTFRVTDKQGIVEMIENAMRFAIKLSALGYKLEYVDPPIEEHDSLVFTVNVRYTEDEQ